MCLHLYVFLMLFFGSFSYICFFFSVLICLFLSYLYFSFDVFLFSNEGQKGCESRWKGGGKEVEELRKRKL